MYYSIEWSIHESNADLDGCMDATKLSYWEKMAYEMPHQSLESMYMSNEQRMEQIDAGVASSVCWRERHLERKLFLDALTNKWS